MQGKWAAPLALLCALPWAARPALSADRGAPKSSAREQNLAARRAVAGAPSDADFARGAESPELRALADAERELFAPASPPVGALWPGDLPAPLPTSPGKPAEDAAAAALSNGHTWLASLDMPDIDVRWDPRVVRYLDFYRDDPRGHALVANFLRKSGRYAASIRRILREQHLPEDLLWVALVESGFDPIIRSPVGASGLWQLMPEGAKVYGLLVNRWIDERLDPERSTDAAARYLSDLHRRFGGWELALAAYNMGYGGLISAIHKYNTNDYWELCKFEAGIPWETTLYVPKIIAIAVVARNLAAFGLSSVEPDPPLLSDAVTVPGGVALRAVAIAAGVPAANLALVNPALRAGRTPPENPATHETQRWTVHVPPGKVPAVLRGLSHALALEPALDRYVVRFGESVDAVAVAQGTSRARLAEINALRADEVLGAGTVLLVPEHASTLEGVVAPATAAAGAAAPVPAAHGLTMPGAEKPVVVVPAEPCVSPGAKRVFYRVMTGDTIKDIAAAFHVTKDDLGRCNALDPAARLHDGLMLQIFVPKGADLSKVVCLGEDSVRVITVGTEEFYAYFEGLRGRKRTTIAAQEGDTWDRLAKRYGLTPGQLERINRRSRTDKLAKGDVVVVYVPLARPVPRPAATASSDPTPLGALVAPNPEDLPAEVDAPAPPTAAGAASEPAVETRAP